MISCMLCNTSYKNIYRVKLYIVSVGKEELVKKRSERSEEEEHTHKESDEWYFTILYYCTYNSEC